MAKIKQQAGSWPESDAQHPSPWHFLTRKLSDKMFAMQRQIPNKGLSSAGAGLRDAKDFGKHLVAKRCSAASRPEIT